MRRFRRLSTAVVVMSVILVLAASVAVAKSPAVVVGTTGNLTIPANGIEQDMGIMNLGPGTWWISATGWLSQSGSSSTPGFTTRCKLLGGTDQDTTEWQMTSIGGRSEASLFLHLVHQSGSSWSATIRCRNTGPNDAVLHDLRIGALKGTLANGGSPQFERTSSANTVHVPASTLKTVGTLSLQAGRWWIVGKTNVVNTASGSTNVPTCKIAIGSTDVDTTRVGLYYPGQQGTEEEVAVQLGHSFSSAGSARLQCSAGHAFSTNNMQMVAIRAGKLVQKNFAGATASRGSGTPEVISGFYEVDKSTKWLSVPAGSSYSTLESLSVPAGSWYLSAKLVLQDVGQTVDCLLMAGADSDHFTTLGGPTGFAGGYLQLGRSSNSNSTISLRCRSNGSGVKANFIRITAVSAHSVSNVQILV